MTAIRWWLGRQVPRRAQPAVEFRADRMDAAWQPELREIAGRERPLIGPMPRLFYR